ncbi:sensor domain-containing diguanylate cyclase [Marinospirillum perlucidum]|uniref:sensor domain-containing diguanylate cyclase n=1 Tax=Marinospirillum perlucidum TaxID=1982602 RepID=UPI000DF12A8B|nr:sensor domain-containing diguanylate cyclase [Marinospirillum perlucidum]
MQASCLLTLHKRILMVALLGVLVTGLLVSLATAIPLYQNARTSLAENNRISTQAQAAAINNLLEKYRGIARQFTSRTEIRRRLQAYQQQQLSLAEIRAFTQPRLADAMRISPAVDALLRLGRNGEVIAQLGQLVNPHEVNKFLRHPSSTQQYIFSGGGKMQLMITADIFDEEGEKLGQDILFFNLQELAKQLVAPTSFGEEAQQLLIHWPTRQQLVGHPLAGLKLQAVDQQLNRLQGHLSTRQQELLVRSQMSDREQLAFSAPLGSQGWTLVIQRPASLFYLSVWERLWLPFITTFCMLVLATLVMTRTLQPLIQDAREQSLQDSLTGLANRNQLEQTLERRVALARHQSKRLAVIFMDLDYFKEVNDSLGHQAGDRILQLVGQRLSRLMREEDLLGRLSGDEFLILVDTSQDRGTAERLATRIIQAIQEPFQLEQQLINLGASLGISHFPEDGLEARDLIRRADLAMYQAKQEGRNNWKTFTRKLDPRTS